jgi:hypothetical protein
MASEPDTLPAWRRALARFVTGCDVVELQRQQKHLAALQNEYDRLKTSGIHSISADRITAIEQQVARLARSGDADQNPPLDPVLDWIRNAENHLSALQAGYDRLESLLNRLTDQVTRATARLALLDARLNDLERADTAIAAAIGRTASSDPHE